MLVHFTFLEEQFFNNLDEFLALVTQLELYTSDCEYAWEIHVENDTLVIVGTSCEVFAEEENLVDISMIREKYQTNATNVIKTARTDTIVSFALKISVLIVQLRKLMKTTFMNITKKY